MIWAVHFQKKVDEGVGVFVFPEDRWNFLSFFLCVCVSVNDSTQPADGAALSPGWVELFFQNDTLRTTTWLLNWHGFRKR